LPPQRFLITSSAAAVIIQCGFTLRQIFVLVRVATGGPELIDVDQSFNSPKQEKSRKSKLTMNHKKTSSKGK
jgi:hypothetical protein